MESLSRRQRSAFAILLLSLYMLHVSATPSDKIRFQVDSEDGRLTVPELIEKYGYPVEEHPVKTTDGYRLMLHRIKSDRPDATVVLLMHGLLCSSADWLMIGPGNALAYLLADRGYDVWLGNARGNRYSRHHDSLSPVWPSFWEFSWHEIGYHDLPATIDYILARTRQSRLHYVGHSQGTTAFFVMASSRPEYNEKVIQMQAMAPVAFMEHMNSPLLLLMTKFLNTLDILTSLFGIGEFMPNTPILHEIAKRICPTTVSNNLCIHLLFLLTGCNPTQLDPAMVPILLGHTPAGAATMQLVHYAQEVRSKRFRMYDFGKVKNYLTYGKLSPPEYNLTRVTAPVVLYYGLNDYLAAPKDVQNLAARLPNLRQTVQVNHKLFNHLDFLMANDVRKLLYDEVIERIAEADKCAQGRAAWLERGRRCSVQETPASCHRRWVKRNRIQDSSLGGSSDDEDLLGVLRGPSSFANAFLYVGLGTIAIGLVIAFVGTGEKGFKTVELRLIGPSLIGLGLLCCTLRILFCICPSHCISSSRRAREKKNAKIDADHRTSLLRGDSKRVSIARGPHIPTKQPQIYPKSIVKAKTYEGVEALRQIATTSLFLQNEQKVSSNRIVPIIKEPEKLEEPPLELKRIDTRRDDASIVSLSDGEDDSHRRQRPGSHGDTQVIDLTGEDQDQDELSHSPGSGGTSHQRKDSKLRRQRTSVHQQKPGRELQSSAYGGSSGTSDGSNLLMETSLMIIGPTPVNSPTKSMTPAVHTSSLTVPLPANGSAVLGTVTKPGVAPATVTATGNLLTLPAASLAAGSTPLPGQLSPLPSTSYLASSMAAYRTSASSIPGASSPLPGFIASPHYNSSSSSSSNYIFSPPPFTQHEPITRGTNTITTASSLLQAPPTPANTTKTEPELVLSPSKLGQ